MLQGIINWDKSIYISFAVVSSHKTENSLGDALCKDTFPSELLKNTDFFFYLDYSPSILYVI